MPGDLNQSWTAFLARPDQPHFAPVYDATKALVWTLCIRVLGNEEDARDAFQSAYTRLLAEIKSRGAALPEHLPPGPFLYRLALNEANNLRKRRGRRALKEVAMDPLPDLLASAAHPGDLAAQKQLRCHLDALVKLLPDDYRLPLQL